MTGDLASARQAGRVTVGTALVYGLAALTVALLAVTDSDVMARSIANLVALIGFFAVLTAWLYFSRALHRLGSSRGLSIGTWGFVGFILLIGAASLVSFLSEPGVTGRVVIPSLLRAAAAAALLIATLILLVRRDRNRADLES